jgi:aryl-alcohol dehydrogenase-like predicted oxidoreductase
MRYLRFAPLDRDLSRLVLGTAAYEHAPLDVSLDVFDAFRELGGNVVDTGREYGNAEAIVGRWLRERRLGDEVVVLTKGAHHDNDTGRRRVNPAEITQDLEESLRTLGRAAIDIYCLHRDDPDVPVGPIVDTLHGHRQAGRVRALGASNWTAARIEEAARYAARHGREPFACSSPGLSLAAPGEAPWLGAVTIHAREARAWYAARQLPVFAWAALAGGFFAGVSSPDVRRVYDSAENRERRHHQPDRARVGAPPALPHLCPRRPAERRRAPGERGGPRALAHAGRGPLARSGRAGRRVGARRVHAPSAGRALSPRT